VKASLSIIVYLFNDFFFFCISQSVYFFLFSMKKVLKIILDFVKLVNLISYSSRSVIYLFILRFPICFCLRFFHQKIKKYIYITCSKKVVNLIF
jgi:hypothetical protein